ncbi:MAG: ABC transporter permease [Planctomycetota bacterium]
MPKALIIALNEALTAVRSKAFLANLLILPIAVGAMVLIQHLSEQTADLSDRSLAIVDHTGELGPKLLEAAEAYNQHVAFETGADGVRKQVKPKWSVEIVPPSELAESSAQGDAAQANGVELGLSDRVRAGELTGFAVLPAGLADADSDDVVRYYARDQVFEGLSDWLRWEVGRMVREARLAEAEIDPEFVGRVQHLTRQVGVRKLGLVDRTEDGGVSDARETNEIQTLVLPGAGMFIMFFLVMFAGPTLMNVVLEEKMQRIAELLVASVTPFQLMLGKLLGGVMFAAVLAAVYLSAGLYAAYRYDVADLLTGAYYGWFALFALLALVIYGAMFVAIGAACSEIRDASTLMAPAMILAMMPVWCWFIVLRSPNSTASVAMSLFPPFTPMLMFLRVVSPSGPPWWQVALGVVLTTAFAGLCLWAAARVFRIGMLSYGQAPTLRQLLRWAVTGR